MPKIALAIPAYNEEKIIEENVRKLYDYLNTVIDNDWEIIIVNNASTDSTYDVAQKLSQELVKVTVLNIREKGRGYALKHAWQNSQADIFAYCDADLSINIKHLPELFSEISHGADLVAGSRYLPNSCNKTILKRWIISKVYVILVKLLFKTKLSDFQCGAKAVNKKVIDSLLPEIEDGKFFFDSELLIMAERTGYIVKEIPIQCSDDYDDSTVDILKNSLYFVFKLVSTRVRVAKRALNNKYEV